MLVLVIVQFVNIIRVTFVIGYQCCIDYSDWVYLFAIKSCLFILFKKGRCCNVASLGGSLVAREKSNTQYSSLNPASKLYSLHYYMVSEVNPQIS